MRVAIMQPYFCPYLGYFKLISSVDKFVLYDNIQYTKKGWINRNRILVNGEPHRFTIPIKKDSSLIDIRDRELAEESLHEIDAILKVISNTYRRAPNFGNVFPLIEALFLHSEKNLFRFIHHTIIELCSYMDIKTEVIISSSLKIDHSLSSSHKVLAICKHLNAKTYLNLPNGKQLYQLDKFKEEGIDLAFQSNNYLMYSQFSEEFVPCLSIIDTIMFCDIKKVKDYLVCVNPGDEKQ